MKELLTQIVEVQSNTTTVLWEMASHLNALENALYARDKDLEDLVKQHVAQQSQARAAIVAKSRTALEKIRKAIAQLPD